MTYPPVLPAHQLIILFIQIDGGDLFFSVTVEKTAYSRKSRSKPRRAKVCNEGRN